MPRTPIRVTYFTVVPLYYPASGGALCCRNHVRRLAQEPEIDLSVCVCGPPGDEPLNRSVVEQLGAELTFVGFRATGERANGRRPLARRWPFLYEAAALEHAHVEHDVMEALRRLRPDVVVVDYVPSASFVRTLYSGSLPRVTITLNREGAFYRELVRHGGVPPGASASRIAAYRAGRFERWVYRRSGAVVALTSADLPAFPGPPRIRSVIPPAFDPNPDRWTWTGSRSVLFVGNQVHYPNRLAIDWLATRLSPELERIGSDVEVRIVGAEESAVPREWRRRNVVYLGTGDATLAERELTGTGAFVAPISNPFGSKIKLLDCLAHGTPFFGTAQALTGIPFVSRPLGPIDLADPGALARDVERLFERPESVVEASDRLGLELDRFLASQRGVWLDLLRRVLASA